MKFRPFVSAEAMLEATRRQAQGNTENMPEGIPAGGTTGQVLKKSSGTNYDADWEDESAGGSTDLKPYCVTGAGSDIPAAATQQDLSTEQIANANYSLATDNITVTDAGTYQVSYSIEIDEDGTSGGTRGRVTGYMTIGGVPIAQSYSGVYVREASGGSGLSATFIVVLSARDVLALFTDQTGTNTPDLSAERTQVSILKVA